MALDPSVFRVVNPSQFYDRFLGNDVRPDGRALLKWRKTSTTLRTIGTADGSCTAKIGNTTVICAIKAEVAKPDVDAPAAGFIDVNVNLSPLCSTSFTIGKPNELSHGIAARVSNILKTSGAVPLEHLVIQNGEHVWVLYVDVVCLNYDGNAFDATLLAVNGALADLRIPVPVLDTSPKATGMVRVKNNETTKLPVRHMPLSLSFTVVNGHVIADANAEEERLGAGTLSIVINDRDEICSIYKPGGATMGDATIRQCIAIARTRCSALQKVLRKSLSKLST